MRFLLVVLSCMALSTFSFTQIGCSDSQCRNGYNQSTVSVSGRSCTDDCNCNNQRYEGYCGSSGVCIAVQRETCTAAKGTNQSCKIHPDLVGVTSCTEGERICKEDGLLADYWGNCRCTNTSNTEITGREFGREPIEEVALNYESSLKEVNAEDEPIVDELPDAGISPEVVLEQSQEKDLTCKNPCKTDDECDTQQNSGQACRNSCCRCLASRGCSKGEYCNQNTGACVTGCQVDADCGKPTSELKRCSYQCKENQCLLSCKECKNPSEDCPDYLVCPKPLISKIDPCRKPIGPFCKKCSADTDCGCKKGDDCKFTCTRKTCSSDTDCKSLSNGANFCYNGRCSTKKICRVSQDCPTGEKCENGICAENCNNRCIRTSAGARCVIACDPLGGSIECPSGFSCIELLPQSGSGPKCLGPSTTCTSDGDCNSKQPRCGEDGYCTACAKGKVCRTLDPRNPNSQICIDSPPTICGPSQSSQVNNACTKAGY